MAPSHRQTFGVTWEEGEEEEEEEEKEEEERWCCNIDASIFI